MQTLTVRQISQPGTEKYQLWVKNCCFRHRPITIARPPSPVRCGFGVDRGRPARHRRRGRGRSLGHPQGHFLILRHGMSLGGLQRNIGRRLLPLQKFTLRMGCWIQRNIWLSITRLKTRNATGSPSMTGGISYFAVTSLDLFRGT